MYSYLSFVISPPFLLGVQVACMELLDLLEVRLMTGWTIT